MHHVDIYTIDALETGRLSIMARPRGGEWLGDEIAALGAAGVDVLVSLLTPAEVAELALAEEAAWCRKHGVQFFAFPIEDRGVPSAYVEIAELLSRLSGLIEQGKHVVVHCRQGIGRTSLVTACLLVTLGHDPDQAFESIAEARGRPVPDTDEQRAWGVAFAGRITTTRSRSLAPYPFE